MSIEVIRVAAYNQIAAIMAADHPSVQLVYDNVPYETPKTGTWMHISIDPGYRRRGSLGDVRPLFRTTGRIRLQIYQSENSGVKNSYEIADTIALKASDKIISASDGTLYTYGVEIGNRGVVEGWQLLTVDIDFKFDVGVTSA